MASLSDVLASVPGLAGYNAQRQYNDQATLGQVQQASGVMGLMQHLQTQQKEQALRAELSGLGPNPSQDQLAQVAAKYAPAQDILKTQQASLDRKAMADDRDKQAEAARADRMLQFQQTLDLRRDDLERKRQEFGDRLTDAKSRDQFNEWFKRESLRIQEQQNQFSNSLRGMGLEIQRQGQQVQLSKLDQQNDNRRVQNQQHFGQAIEKAGIPEGDAALRAAESALKETPELSDYLTGVKSTLPDMMIPPNVAKAKQAFAKLFNITLKNRSGAAVTIPELERLKTEFGTGLLKTPKQIEEGLRQAREIITKHYQGISAGFTPEVVQGYNDNLSASGGAPMLTQPVAAGWDDAKEKRYQDLLKKRGGNAPH